MHERKVKIKIWMLDVCAWCWMCVFRELERRAAQRRCQVVVRVLCNRQVVCRSRPLSLYPHFTSCLNQLFCLQISDWPQSLTLELLVEGGLGPGKRLSASIFVPVPNRFKLYSDFFLTNMQYTKNMHYLRQSNFILFVRMNVLTLLGQS